MRYGVEVLASNLYECILHSIYRTGAMSSHYLSCYSLLCRRKTLRPRTSSNFTDLHIISLPRIPGEVDTEERGYINASHHGGSSCSITGSDGIFSLPPQSCANLFFFFFFFFFLSVTSLFINHNENIGQLTPTAFHLKHTHVTFWLVCKIYGVLKPSGLQTFFKVVYC